jgi:ornithine--oxo-acid transaminase
LRHGAASSREAPRDLHGLHVAVRVALAHNLCGHRARRAEERVFLTTCGSVANEASLKLAERYAGPKRATIAYAASNSFHGKTRAAPS